MPYYPPSDAGSRYRDTWSAPDAYDDPPQCSSGTTWELGSAEDELMQPGATCIRCHLDFNSASGEGDAPVFGVAGTVFPTHHEPDGCIGSGSVGAIVRITDGRGQRIDLPVNASGNFFLDDVVALPYRAQVIFEDRVVSMLEPRTDGDCNACHTAAGGTTEDGGTTAPGRIRLP